MKVVRAILVCLSLLLIVGFVSIAHADAWNVELVGRTYAAACDVYAVNDYAYVYTRDLLVVLNVSDRSKPNLVACIDTPGVAVSPSPDPFTTPHIDVVGDHVYVPAWESLRVIDVSDPHNPIEAGFYDIPGWSAIGVHVVGKYAYMTGWRQLTVLDVSDPHNLGMIGSCDTPEGTTRIHVAGDHAYLANMYAGLSVINISDPRNPVEVGFYDPLGGAFEVYVSGHYAFVASNYGLRVLDISDPHNPIEVGFYIPPGDEFYTVIEVYMAGNHLYLAGYGYGSAGLRVLDVSDPHNPVEVGFYDYMRAPFGIHVVEDYAYLAVAEHGLRVMNVSELHGLHEVGFYDTPGSARGVHVLGSYAYVADWYEGLHVIDVSDPYKPNVVGHCYELGDERATRAVYAVGNYAYMGNYWDGILHVVDASDPTNPYEVGFCSAPSHAHGVYAVADYAYVADDNRGLFVMDVSDPHNPSEAGFCDAGDARGVHVVGHYAYVATRYDGLRIIDVSDPHDPVEVGFYNVPGIRYAEDVYVTRNYACVAGDDFYVIDVSDPMSPNGVGFYDTPRGARDVYVAGYAYVADGAAGLRVIDISHPSSPSEVGFYDTPGDATGVHAWGDYGYIADGSYGGLCILRYVGPDCASPAAVMDLAAPIEPTGNTIDLEWTAPGDDWDIGTASEYIMRYHTAPITESNWDASSDVDGEPTPGPAGSSESMTVTVPYPGVTCYFAIKTQDEVPNTSEINIDRDAPQTSVGLSGTKGENVWWTSNVIVTLSAKDIVSGVKETKYKINSGSWQNYSSEFTVTGSTVHYYSEDNAGNIEAEKSVEIKIDKTAPETPAVTDDGYCTTDDTQLHASWQSSDAESGVVEYQYAIGTTPGGKNVVNWTSTGTDTEVTRTGLSLTLGQTCYFSAKAKNEAGLWSSAGNSDGIVYLLPQIGASLSNITFIATSGGANPSPKTLNITNPGCGTLNWTATDDADWLSLSPAGGDTTTETDEVIVSVDITGLTEGTYNADITIASANASNSPLNVPVTLYLYTGDVLSIPLYQGFNLFSIPYDLPETDIDVVLAGIVDSMESILAFRGGEWYISVPNPSGGWIAEQIGDINGGEAFIVYMTSAADLEVIGTPLESTQTPVVLQQGFNLAPYNSGTEKTVDEAFSGVKNNLEGILIYYEGDWQLCVPDPADGWKIEQFETVWPGLGFVIYSLVDDVVWDVSQ